MVPIGASELSSSLGGAAECVPFVLKVHTKEGEMAPKSAGVTLVCFVSSLIAPILCLLAGCALQRDMAGPVFDHDFEWVRGGFSVKAPSGGGWSRLQADGSNPNSVAFQKAEGLAYADFTPKNILYIKGATAFAYSTILDEPVYNRKDKNLVALALRKHLERCLLGMKQTLVKSVYDASLGADCVKYGATSTLKRIPTDNGDMHIDAIHGYFCLHSDLDNFAVIMQTSTFATVWTDIPQKEGRSTFFKSLRFLPISSSVARNFTKNMTRRDILKTPVKPN